MPLDKIDSESESVPQKDDANDEQDEQDLFVINLTKNLISNTVQMANEE